MISMMRRMRKMNPKIKEILGKYKETVDSDMKYVREKAYLERMKPEEIMEILKMVIDECEKPEKVCKVITDYPVMVMDSNEESTSPNSGDINSIKFDIGSATTCRMMDLLTSLDSVLRRVELCENWDLVVDYCTYSKPKFDRLRDIVGNILLEDNALNGSAIDHRFMIKFPNCPNHGDIKYMVRIKNHSTWGKLSDYHLQITFEKVSPIEKMEEKDYV